VTGAVMIAARAAARRLETEGRPGLRAEVEALLAARQTGFAPPQYTDPVAIASLIVSIASLAWTVYTDLRKRTTHPSADLVARTVRDRLGENGQQAPYHVVDVVVTEAILAIEDPGDP
jgi:hypothetical protein